MRADGQLNYCPTASKVMHKLLPIIVAVLLSLVGGCSECCFRQDTSSAMSPAILTNQVVTADLSAYRKTGPSRWDVIVFHPPPEAVAKAGDIWILRVIALPGEQVAIRDGGIYINGKREAQPDRLAGIRYTLTVPGAVEAEVSFPYRVPADCYFVLGDNATNSLDSRFWGAMPRQRILGKVKDK
jgi:signal peptidase I